MLYRLEEIAKLFGDRGKFYCLACKCDITAIVYKIPHDGKEYKRKCPRCNKVFTINSILMAFQIMMNKRPLKWTPSVESNKNGNGLSSG